MKMQKLKTGIAICTYNRLDTLKNTIAKVMEHTKTDYDLVIVDDGSSDNTFDEIKKIGVTILSPSNRGIAWNKNRALFYLKNIAKSDRIIVIEDDTFPIEDQWESAWQEAIDKWGHVNLAWKSWPPGFSADGNGTPLRPYKSFHLSAQCSGFSAHCIELVGYMDSRFRGYGMEHVDHTNRILRAGLGGETDNCHSRNLYYLINSNMNVLFEDENVHKQIQNDNMSIFIDLMKEGMYRLPWINDEEMVIFLSEFNEFRENKIVFEVKNSQNKKMAFDIEKGELRFIDRNIMNENNVKKVFFYYNGRRVELITEELGKIKYITKNITEDGYKFYISDVQNFSMHVDLDKKSGFYFREKNLYLTSNQANNNIVSIDREVADEWEKFYFDQFISIEKYAIFESIKGF